jgi:hypothetical protein
MAPHLFRPFKRLSLVLAVLLVVSLPALGADAGSPADGSAAAADAGEALRKAASAGDLAKVQELLAAGVDVNAANGYGGTALAFACDRGHAAVVDLLLARGADANVADTYYHATPLVWAVDKGHAEIVRSLLAKGAKGAGDALVSAAGSGHPAVVAVILERDKLSADKLTAEVLTDALVAAKKGEHAEVAAQLEAAGAKPPPVVTVDPAVLASYEGAYENADLQVAVTTKDGKVILTTDRWTLTFVAADTMTFRAEEVPGLKVRFDVEAGKVTGVTLLRSEGDPTLLKKKATP